MVVLALVSALVLVSIVSFSALVLAALLLVSGVLTTVARLERNQQTAKELME